MAVKTRNQVSPVKRVTRATVQQGLVTESLPELTTSTPSTSISKKTKKKVKFLDPGKEQETNKNTSLVSDEGIDMSWSPGSAGLQLPPAISRPQHPLQQSWTMWYSPKNQKTNWCENQHQVCSMATVEEFWQTYNQVFIIIAAIPCSRPQLTVPIEGEAGKQTTNWINIRCL